MAEVTTATPIPTVFQGVHFRSRLEARWAFFFEKIGCGGEYEPEGVVIHFDGRSFPYAPDFKLKTRDWACYAEVKPFGLPDVDRSALVWRLARFAEAKKHTILLLEGRPGECLWHTALQGQPQGSEADEGEFDWIGMDGFDRYTVRDAERAANGTWWDQRGGQ